MLPAGLPKSPAFAVGAVERNGVIAAGRYRSGRRHPRASPLRLHSHGSRFVRKIRADEELFLRRRALRCSARPRPAVLSHDGIYVKAAGSGDPRDRGIRACAITAAGFTTTSEVLRMGRGPQRPRGPSRASGLPW